MSKLLQAYAGKGGLLSLKVRQAMVIFRCAQASTPCSYLPFSPANPVAPPTLLYPCCYPPLPQHTQEDKHSGDVFITAVNRLHPTLRDFRPMPARATAAGAADGTAALPAVAGDSGSNADALPSSSASAAAGAGGGTVSSVSAAVLPELYIEELWRAGRELRPVTEAVGVPGDAMFTEKEVRGLLPAWDRGGRGTYWVMPCSQRRRCAGSFSRQRRDSCSFSFFRLASAMPSPHPPLCRPLALTCLPPSPTGRGHCICLCQGGRPGG